MLRFLIIFFLASLALFGGTPVWQLAHAGAGALKEQLKGGDPLAGAVGAVVAETAAEAMDKPGATPEERQTGLNNMIKLALESSLKI